MQNIFGDTEIQELQEREYYVLSVQQTFIEDQPFLRNTVLGSGYMRVTNSHGA